MRAPNALPVLALAASACVLIPPDEVRYPTETGTVPTETDTDTDTDTDADTDTDTDTDTPTGETGTPPLGPVCPAAGKTAVRATLSLVPTDPPFAEGDLFRVGGFEIFPALTPTWETQFQADAAITHVDVTDVEPDDYVLVACLDRLPFSQLCSETGDIIVLNGGLLSPTSATFPPDGVVTFDWQVLVDEDTDADGKPDGIILNVVTGPKDPSCP